MKKKNIIIITLAISTVLIFDICIKNDTNKTVNRMDIEFTEKLMREGAPAPLHNGVYKNYLDYENQMKERKN